MIKKLNMKFNLFSDIRKKIAVLLTSINISHNV